jgi:hypothetical protein
VLTYKIGNSIDQNDTYQVHKYENPDDSVVLCVNETVWVTLKNGADYYGQIVTVFDDNQEYDFQLKSDNRVISMSFDKIELIQIMETPRMGRCLCTSVGVIADAYVIAVAVVYYIFINAFKELGQ